MTLKAKVTQVADGLVFPEGPVWFPDGYLLFSDVHGATIQELLPEGGTRTWWDVGKKTNGLIMAPGSKDILACCYSERELIKIDGVTKAYEVLARECDGRGFLNVNDVAVDLNGTIYFSDPCWDPSFQEYQAVYMITPHGEVLCAARVQHQPNGLVVSPDQKYLFVARSGAHDIIRYRRAPEGHLVEGEVWAKLADGAEPDGMTINSQGELYLALAGTGEVQVLSWKGKNLGLIKICEKMATNCEFEGAREDVLYVTGGGTRNARSGRVWKIEF